MINAEKSIYLHETEVKPNKYARLVMTFLMAGEVFCLILTEIGLFRVGAWEMRIGASITFIAAATFFIYTTIKKESMEKPSTKWAVFIIASLFTFVMGTLLTFHTTIMLLFPIFIAMLYRSVPFGIAAVCSSMICTAITPILGYLIKSWDIPLFQELILIGTGVEAIVENPTYETTWVGIVKILLYLVLPRLIMIGSCSILLFHTIRLGRENVDNQIKLDQINRRDVLTGFYNQNYFKQILSAKNDSQIVGVVFFDVNGLKKINDQFGHEQGDMLLKRCADALTSLCDGEHIHGFRLGGDEFLILIEDADESKITSFNTRWRENIGRINEENKTDYDGLICSMASGYQIGNITDLEELVRRADEQMYANKALMKAGC